MGQKSLSGPSAVSIMESLLDMLARVLSPLMAGQSGTDTTLLQYLLKYKYKVTVYRFKKGLLLLYMLTT